ncbi:MFS transporter [Burkholderia sp. 4701]|nr:MFS transporter [Burkholderia sp. 4701]MXN84016.1 MFS transporter [Burkholderia sp. 4812]
MTRPLPDAGSPAEPPPDLFRHIPFQRFWGTRVMSSLGFQILSVAIGWHVYALTHSAFALGLVGLAQFVPMFALTLVVGQVADRYDRRRIAMLCQTVEACVAGAFLLGSASGWLTASGIYVLAMIVGTARAFESPSVSSLLPAVVPRGDLPRATALSTSANQAAQILGPACGGLLYGLGAPVAFGASVAAFALAALLSGTIPLRSAPPAREPVTLRSVFSGIAFIRREPAILGALSLDLFAVLFGGATALLPIYARDILQVGPWGLGALRAAPAFGALAGTLWLARFPLRGRPGRAMFGGVIAFGVATIVFGLSRHFTLSLVALAVLGASDVISVVVRLSLVQLRTPGEMLGRVSAVNALFIGTSNQLGEFESGVTAAWWGAPGAIVVGGAATILVALAWMRLFPQLTNMTSLERDR